MSMAEEQRIRVLIVDDHPMVREGLRSMLSTARHLEVVGEAGTAHEAVVQAQALQPDVILLDIQLPDMDGVTVLPRLKTVASAAQVLIVTMHEDAAHILRRSLRERLATLSRGSAAVSCWQPSGPLLLAARSLFPCSSVRASNTL